MWLIGKPKAIISLLWPTDDFRLEGLKNNQLAYTLLPSILDDQILYTIVQRDPPTSFVYLARVHEAIADDQQQVIFALCAVLPYAVRDVALLTHRTGFASFTYDERKFVVTLRVHDWDGSIANETSTFAEAAHGRLIVQEDALGVCISPQKEPGDEFAPRDNIFVWNWKVGSFYCIMAPYQPNLQYMGIFGFLDQHYTAVGGVFSPAQTPSISDELTPTSSYEGLESETVAERALSIDSVESLPETIDTASVYYNDDEDYGSCVSLLRKTPSPDMTEPGPDDLIDSYVARPHETINTAKTKTKTTKKMLNPYPTPSALSKGISIYFEIDNQDDSLRDFVFDTSNRLVFLLCDFNSEYCSDSDTTNESQESLNEQSEEGDEILQVTIIQTNYFTEFYPDEHNVDVIKLYNAPRSLSYMEDFYKRSEHRKKEKPVKRASLVLDEGLTNERTHHSRLVFTRSLAARSSKDYWTLDCQKLALSTSGIINVPDPGEEGHIFVFKY